VAAATVLIVASIAKAIAHIPNPSIRKWVVIVCALTISVVTTAYGIMKSFDRLRLASQIRYFRNAFEDSAWIVIILFSLSAMFVLTLAAAGSIGFLPANVSPYQPRGSKWRIVPLLKLLSIGLAATTIAFALHDAFILWSLKDFASEAADTQRAMTPAPIPDNDNAAFAYQSIIDRVENESDEDTRTMSALYENSPPDYYASLEPIAETMMQATRFSSCRFADEKQSLHILDGMTTNYGLTTAAQRLTKLAAYRASQGEIDEAIALLNTVRSMERHILADPRNREPLLFQWYECWIRLVMETLSLQPNVSCDQIKRLAAPDLPVAEIYLEGIRWHRAALQDHLANVYTGREFQRSEIISQEVWKSTSPQAAVARWLTLVTMRFLHAPDDIAAFETAFAPSRIADSYEFDDEVWDATARGKFLGPATSISYARTRALTADAERKLINIAIASICFREDHSRWPRSFDELVPQYLLGIPKDAFTGAPFRALSINGGIIFYSAERDETFNRFDDSNNWWKELQEYGMLCLRLGTAAEKGKK
jgi:hypothetical protein